VSGHPVFDELEHARLAAAREWRSIQEHISDVLHHETPATPPVNLAAATARPKGDTMSLSTIAADIKGAIENADQWVGQITEQHLPAILAAAAKYENSPVVQALESAFLTPAEEQQIASLIALLASKSAAAPVQAQQAQ
jgi:hypothetical protein